jgi:hypothetical protein
MGSTSRESENVDNDEGGVRQLGQRKPREAAAMVLAVVG